MSKRPTKSTGIDDEMRRIRREIESVVRELDVFKFKGKHRPTKAVQLIIAEVRRAFDGGHYGLTEHLLKVAQFMIRRDAPKFTADPKKWTETREELSI